MSTDASLASAGGSAGKSGGTGIVNGMIDPTAPEDDPSALERWELTSFGERRAVRRLAAQGREHPDPKTAHAARVWASRVPARRRPGRDLAALVVTILLLLAVNAFLPGTAWPLNSVIFVIAVSAIVNSCWSVVSIRRQTQLAAMIRDSSSGTTEPRLDQRRETA